MWVSIELLNDRLKMGKNGSLEAYGFYSIRFLLNKSHTLLTDGKSEETEQERWYDIEIIPLKSWKIKIIYSKFMCHVIQHLEIYEGFL